MYSNQENRGTQRNKYIQIALFNTDHTFFIENVMAKSKASSVNQQTNVKAVEKGICSTANSLWCV